ncbi:MAG: FAD-dependent oxidoreductase [SAR324 cluster bacterium]|nr:FAD-dependent oxidoreductase [SAR324 cluster bacterium]
MNIKQAQSEKDEDMKSTESFENRKPQENPAQNNFLSRSFDSPNKVSLYYPRSYHSTENNKTGSWRFARPDYQNKTAPCSTACPVGTHIPQVEMLAAAGDFKAALKTILRENPFPAVCGRVCFHPCENSCNRIAVDEIVGINKIERFLGDFAFCQEIDFPFEKQLSNAKRIAIIGAGPAGLSAAYFLTILGFSCEVFESASEPGGILRHGIPEYRLPKDILSEEIKRIEQMGVQIHCGIQVDENFLAEAKDRYDAFFIGCGYSRSIQLNIPGAEFILDGLKFLKQVHQEKIISISGKVAVIGGGNTAVDVARSLLRFGAKPTIVYRRRIQDMPAFKQEIEAALEEGIEIIELSSPLSLFGENEDLILTVQKMKPGTRDGSGRTSVVPDGNQTQTLGFSKIYFGIGAEVGEDWHLPNNRNNELIQLSHCRIATGDSPVVYGGDLTNNIQSVADAIASGKQAAISLDVYFKKGEDLIEKTLNSCKVGNGLSHSMEAYIGGINKNRDSHVVSKEEINIDYFPTKPGINSETISVEARRTSFSEVEQPLMEESIVKEAKRCFNCGICNECDNCNLFCPDIAVIKGENGRSINLDYCKGCGICVEECPRGAMVIEEEKI